MSRVNGRNAKLIKIHNRALVLKIIQQHGAIARKQIARMTGLTQAAITKITRYLLERGLIVEQDSACGRTGGNEGASGGASGRKPIGLAINRERYKIIAIHVGRECLEAAVSDLAGNFLHKHGCRKRVITQDRDRLVQDILGAIRELLQAGRFELQDVLGIGIAAPGPINARRGILRGLRGRRGGQAPFDWREIALTETIQQELGVNVFADNDANVSALAESWFGQGVGLSNFVLYSIGLGIGAGVIIDGMLYRGEDDVVSEIGHITVDLHGPRCACGNVGCLELYAGFADLLESYRAATHDAPITDVAGLFRAAAAGNADALRLIRQKARYLGTGAVALANIFSPESIIVAANEIGSVDLGLIVEELQNNVVERAFSVIANKVTVLQSGLGADIQLYGGVALVLQDFFQLLPKSLLEKNRAPRPADQRR